MLPFRNFTSRKNQRGLSLVLAIFILVVMALLGAALINIISVGSESVAREVVSARALFAAESGAQRQLNAIFPPGAATATGQCSAAAGTVRSNNFVLSGLNGCDTAVTVDCSYITVNGVNYFTLVSTGRCGPAGDAAVRVIEVQARDL